MYNYKNVTNYDKRHSNTYYQLLSSFNEIFSMPKMIFLLDLFQRSDKPLYITDLMKLLDTSFYKTQKMLDKLIKYKIIRKHNTRYIVLNSQRQIIKSIIPYMTAINIIDDHYLDNGK